MLHRYPMTIAFYSLLILADVFVSNDGNYLLAILAFLMNYM